MCIYSTEIYLKIENKGVVNMLIVNNDVLNEILCTAIIRSDDSSTCGASFVA